jgi:hypothetical protein
MSVIEAKPPAPCIACRNQSRCRTEKLACDALVIYLRVSGAPERWALAPRNPSAAIYERAHAKSQPQSRPRFNRDTMVDIDS